MEEIITHNVQCKDNPLWSTTEREIIDQLFADHIRYKNYQDFKHLYFGNWETTEPKDKELLNMTCTDERRTRDKLW